MIKYIGARAFFTYGSVVTVDSSAFLRSNGYRSSCGVSRERLLFRDVVTKYFSDSQVCSPRRVGSTTKFYLNKFKVFEKLQEIAGSFDGITIGDSLSLVRCGVSFWST